MKLKKLKPLVALHQSRELKKTAYRFRTGSSERAKEVSRERYRAERGKDYELTGNIVLRALEHIDLDAEELPVVNQITAQVEVMPILRLTYVAKLLNVSYQTVWRWTTETQQLPMPVLIDNSKGREYPVYHLEEIRVIVQIIGEHLRGFKYYRSDHEATKRKVFHEIEMLRSLNFKIAGESNHGYQEKRQGTGNTRKARKLKRSRK